MSLLPLFQWVNEINIQCQPLHLCTHRTLLLCSDSTTVPFPLSKFSLPPRSFLLAHKDAMCCAKLPQSCPTLCNLWTIALQAPLSMGFSRQEYWSGLLCSPPGDLPTQESSPRLLCILHWQAGLLLLAPLGKPPKIAIAILWSCNSSIKDQLFPWFHIPSSHVLFFY